MRLFHLPIVLMASIAFFANVSQSMGLKNIKNNKIYPRLLEQMDRYKSDLNALSDAELKSLYQYIDSMSEEEIENRLKELNEYNENQEEEEDEDNEENGNENNVIDRAEDINDYYPSITKSKSSYNDYGLPSKLENNNNYYRFSSLDADRMALRSARGNQNQLDGSNNLILRS